MNTGEDSASTPKGSGAVTGGVVSMGGVLAITSKESRVLGTNLNGAAGAALDAIARVELFSASPDASHQRFALSGEVCLLRDSFLIWILTVGVWSDMTIILCNEE